MKLKFFKAAVILGLLVILSANAFAQGSTATELALRLSDVSTENFIYECITCIKAQQQPNDMVEYSCTRDAPDCVLTVKTKSEDGFRTIATLTFGKSLLYFDKSVKHLMYIKAYEANTQPFDINGIQIPYVAEGDIIKFNEYADWGSGRNAEYFNQFQYKRGEKPLAQARANMQTPLNTQVQRREQLPLILCGQEFFDTISETIRGRNRNSFFHVEKSGGNCAVKSFRISTKPDLAYLARATAQQPVQLLNLYRREYTCGRNHAQFATITGTQSETRPTTTLTNFECNAESDVARLNCPESNQDEKRLCEEQTKNVLLQAGSTLYYVTGGKITVQPGRTNGETRTGTIIQILDSKSITAHSGTDSVEVLPDAQDRENSVEIRFMGQLDDEQPSGESQLIIKNGAVTLTEAGVPKNRFLLNWPEGTPEQFRYSLTFDNNILKTIKDPAKQGSGSKEIGSIDIIGLRTVENLAARSSPATESLINTIWGRKTFNLYPLREGESDVRQQPNYIKYTVNRDGMKLTEIAALFSPSTIIGLRTTTEPVTSTPRQEAQIQEFMSAIRTTSGRYYYGIPEARRGPGEWYRGNDDTSFRRDDIVLVPLEGSSYFGPNGNQLFILQDPAQAGQNLEQRSQRRGRRAGTDNPCTSLGGECWDDDNARAGASCTLSGNSNTPATYIRNRCLSNPSTRYLCCLPVGQSTGQRPVSGRTNLAMPTTCPGECVPVFGGNPPVLLERQNEFCTNYRRGWVSYGISNCQRSELCCGSESQTQLQQPQRARECNTNSDCESLDKPICGHGGICTKCADRDGDNPGRSSYVAYADGRNLPYSIQNKLDRCWLLPETIRFLTPGAKEYMMKEAVCSSGSEAQNRPGFDNPTSTATYKDYDCRTVLRNPNAICLYKMTTKGNVGYCGLPSSQRVSTSAVCTRRGGECKSEDRETFRDDYNNDRNTFCRSFGKKSAGNCDTIGTDVVNVCCVPDSSETNRDDSSDYPILSGKRFFS